jgi:hypothetical protein
LFITNLGKRSVVFSQNAVDDDECDQKPDFRNLGGRGGISGKLRRGVQGGKGD